MQNFKRIISAKEYLNLSNSVFYLRVCKIKYKTKMAKWMQVDESPQCSDNENSYDDEMNDMSTIDEPIDLKQVICESHPTHDDASNDWDTSRLVKTKAFRIKDILGLDDNEKLAKAKSMPISFTTLASSPSTVPCTYNFTQIFSPFVRIKHTFAVPTSSCVHTKIISKDQKENNEKA